MVAFSSRYMSYQTPLKFPQKTIKKTLNFQGVGLHTGKAISLTLHPSPPNTGIIFSRSDISNEKKFSLKAEHIVQTRLNTQIAHPTERHISISTIEHLLSALHALSLDNLLIEINGPECPALDGSSKEFFHALLETGIDDLPDNKKFIKILEPLEVKEIDGSWVRLSPTYDAIFSLHVAIDFPFPIIGKQEHHYIISYQTPLLREKSIQIYHNEIAPARTFIDYNSIQTLQSQGLALGGSLSNALVVKGDNVLNPEGLFFPNEFARHKLLDALGDLYCANYNFIGHFEGFKCGHKLNNSLLQALSNNQKKWCLI